MSASSQRFLEEYSNRPISIKSKKDAVSNLIRAGLLDKDGNIINKYKPLIAEKGEKNNDQGSTF